MPNLFEHLFFWHWLGLAAILLILEVMTGSGFLLWIGISAGVVGILLLLLPSLNWIVQLLTFSLLALSSWWLYLKYCSHTKTPHSRLNRRAEQQIGRVFTLETPVIDGMGKIRIDDSIWRVRCPNVPVGTEIRIVKVDGVILIAEAVLKNNV